MSILDEQHKNCESQFIILSDQVDILDDIIESLTGISKSIESLIKEDSSGDW